MGLSEIRKKLMLQSAKKSKKMQELLNDFSEIVDALNAILEKIAKFEKKWGSSREFRELTREELFEELISIRKLSKPSLLDKLTGKYINYLALEILSLPREIKKPILSLSEILVTIQNKIPSVEITDIKKAIDLLKKRRLIIDVFKVNNIIYIEFPEIYNDIKAVTSYMQENRKKTITINEIALGLNWDVTRAERVLERMVEMGILAKEEYPRRYWLIALQL